MAPIKPHWVQPSHPDTLELIVNEAEFTSKSLSKVDLPPFAVFSKLAFPPCDLAPNGATYATVQMGRDKHLNLNSDLLYINHSCEPSLIFDTANLNVLVGPNGLKAGEELSFFYPSTEWHMAQPFDCMCNTPSCRGRISGAKDMTKAQLQGVWLNGHIRELLDEKEREETLSSSLSPSSTAAATPTDSGDPTAVLLRDALSHAEKVVEAARLALQSYTDSDSSLRQQKVNGAYYGSGKDFTKVSGERRGVTSRELAGEMGGDTVAA